MPPPRSCTQPPRRIWRSTRPRREGLRRAEQAQEIFSRIFTLFALFAAGVGLLLVFLIFTILAADRRPEMGIGRVVGLKRRDLVWMYLFEGTAYALVAAGAGLGPGDRDRRRDRRYPEPGARQLRLHHPALCVHGRAAAISYALGLLATWITVVLACWWATRLTISSAIRDLPEPPELSPGPIRALLQPWRRLPRLRPLRVVAAVLAAALRFVVGGRALPGA